MISLGSFLFVALFLSVRADESTSINEEDHVLVLNTNNFDYAVKTYKYLLVEFCMSFQLYLKYAYILIL